MSKEQKYKPDYQECLDLLPGFKKLNSQLAQEYYQKIASFKYKKAEKREGAKGFVTEKCSGIGFLEITHHGNLGTIVISKELRRAYIFGTRVDEAKYVENYAKMLMVLAGWDNNPLIEYRDRPSGEKEIPYYQLGREIENEHYKATRSPSPEDGRTALYFLDELSAYYEQMSKTHQKGTQDAALSGHESDVDAQNNYARQVFNIIFNLEKCKKAGINILSMPKADPEHYSQVWEILTGFMKVKGIKIDAIKMNASQEQKADDHPQPDDHARANAVGSQTIEEIRQKIKDSMSKGRQNVIILGHEEDNAREESQELPAADEPTAGVVAEPEKIDSAEQAQQPEANNTSSAKPYARKFEEHLSVALAKVRSAREQLAGWTSVLRRIIKNSQRAARQTISRLVASRQLYWTTLKQRAQSAKVMAQRLNDSSKKYLLPAMQEKVNKVGERLGSWRSTAGTAWVGFQYAARQAIAKFLTCRQAQGMAIKQRAQSAKIKAKNLNENIIRCSKAAPEILKIWKTHATGLCRRITTGVKHNGIEIAMGGAAGAASRIAIQFALASAITAPPAWIAVGAAITTGAVAGGASSLMRATWKYYRGQGSNEKYWAAKAFLRGMPMGALGGIAGFYATNWLFSHDVIPSGVEHHAQTPSSVHTPPSVSEAHAVPEQATSAAPPTPAAGAETTITPAALEDTPINTAPATPAAQPVEAGSIIKPDDISSASSDSPPLNHTQTPSPSDISPAVQEVHRASEQAASAPSQVPAAGAETTITPAAPEDTPINNAPTTPAAQPVEGGSVTKPDDISTTPPAAQPVNHVPNSISPKPHELLSADQIKSLPRWVQELVAGKNPTPAQITSFCEEAAYHLMNGPHRDPETAAKLLQNGINIAKESNLANHTVEMLRANYAYMLRWGIGVKQDMSGAFEHAKLAGNAINNYAARMLKTLPKSVLQLG